MLVLKNVSKSFGDVLALSEISLNIDEGEFVFLSGPSGAGKTTLLRLILRELLPDSGEILLDDRDITKLSEKEIPGLRRQIGVVFQDFKVLPERTLRENIEVALAVIGVPETEWKERVDHMLSLTGLTDRASFFPSQLSGGELQRVSLARALSVNPKLILADEPTGNLDWDTANSLVDLFKAVNREGKTVLMATHHRLIIDKLGGRVIELKDGKMVGAEKRKPGIKKEKTEAVKKSVKVKEGVNKPKSK
jgi:cell division transport system ATP-binding protein